MIGFGEFAYGFLVGTTLGSAAGFVLAALLQTAAHIGYENGCTCHRCTLRDNRGSGR